MKKYIIFPIVLIQCFLSVSGQVTFDKGYIIDNSGVKTECLIKNYNWWSNPKTIQYRLSKESPAVSAPIDSIREFQVDNYPRFLRATVKIDRSPIDIHSLSQTRMPLWSEETLFLKELVSGKACLWIYTEDRSWFFYSLDGSLPEQLIYKEYNQEGESGVYTNNGFRQQLYMNMQTNGTKGMNIENMKYLQEPLVQYFKRYNSDFEAEVQPDIKKPEREVLNLKITGSLNYSRLRVENTVMLYRYNFGGKTNWMGGLELEYFLPFNRNKVSILLAPTFEHYKAGKIFYENRPSGADMTTVHFPIGARYGFYLNNDMKFFFDAYFNPFDLYINKNNGFVHHPNSPSIKIRESANFLLGGGFAYKKWQIELQYHTSRDLFRDYIAWKANYTKIVLSVSYKLFSVRE